VYDLFLGAPDIPYIQVYFG